MHKIIIMLLLLIPSIANAGHFPSVCHNELYSWIKANKVLSIVDIQDSESFRAHNYSGSFAVGTDSFRLKKYASELRSKKGNVIVVSSTGGRDAVQAAEKLVKWGVHRYRLVVLEGGMEAAAGKVECDCCNSSSVQSLQQ